MRLGLEHVARHDFAGKTIGITKPHLQLAIKGFLADADRNR
jgi:hypothetical protein